MSKNHAEAVDYDLSTTGVIAEVTSGPDKVGVTLEATAAADFELEYEGHSAGPFTKTSYAAVSSIDDLAEIPEGITVRLKNTATASGTADALLGGTND